jgi:hypothetical protein
VFPKDSFFEIATAWKNANMEDEFTTLAVTPGAKYWIWVAADDGSTGGPTNYDLTLCGGSFTPDPAALAPDPRIRRHPVFTRTVRPISKR